MKEKEYLEKFQEVSIGNTEAFRKEAEESIRAIRSDYESRLDQIKNSITAAEEYASQVSSKMESRISQLDDVVSQKMIDIQNSTNTLASESDSTIRRVSEFVNSVNNRLSDFDSALNESMQQIASEYDSRQASFLSGLDKQLEDYKADMQYRFERLDSAGADVDKLEEALHQSMKEAQNNVLLQFNRFNDEQHQRQNEFEEAVRKNSENIESQLEELESQVNELKSIAANNVAVKLKDFEQNFLDALVQRGDLLSGELDKWKDDFDNKLNVLQSDFEGERNSLEIKYNEDFLDFCTKP